MELGLHMMVACCAWMIGASTPQSIAKRQWIITIRKADHQLLFQRLASIHLQQGGCPKKESCIKVRQLVDMRRYGWGRNAAPLQYPEGVGMAIGAGSGVAFIVVQV